MKRITGLTLASVFSVGVVRDSISPMQQRQTLKEYSGTGL